MRTKETLEALMVPFFIHTDDLSTGNPPWLRERGEHFSICLAAVEEWIRSTVEAAYDYPLRNICDQG